MAKRTKLAIKIFCVNYKGKKCNDCGWNTNDISEYICFDFHHKNEKTKEFELSKSTSKSLHDIKNELDKCDMLCAICHRKRHKSNYTETQLDNAHQWLQKIDASHTGQRYCASCSLYKDESDFRPSKKSYYCRSCCNQKECLRRKNKVKVKSMINNNGTLFCSKCEQHLTQDCFYPNPKTKRGFSYMCKNCNRKRKTTSVTRRSSRHDVSGNLICKTCQNHYDKSNFYKCGNVYSSYCKSCHNNKHGVII